MRVDLAVLADYATTTADGKLIIVGVFDTISVKQFPAVHPSMSLALRVCTGPEDAGEHTLTVRLVDPDGHEIAPTLEAGFTVDFPPESDDQGALQLVMGLGNVEFKSEGPYAVDILVDGRYEDSVSLRVTQRS